VQGAAYRPRSPANGEGAAANGISFEENGAVARREPDIGVHLYGLTSVSAHLPDIVKRTPCLRDANDVCQFAFSDTDDVAVIPEDANGR